MQLIKPYANALMRIGVCNKNAGNVFGQNLWCFRLPGRRRPTHFPGPWNCPGRCRQRCLLLTPPPSSRLPVGWLRSDSPCGFGSAHIPVLLARPHLSIVTMTQVVPDSLSWEVRTHTKRHRDEKSLWLSVNYKVYS